MPARRLLAGAAVLAAVAATAFAGTATAAPAPQGTGSAAAPAAKLESLDAKRTCAAHPKKGHASCYAEVLTTNGARPYAAATPQGYGPADLKSAYKLPDGGDGRTVAIVDANDDPTAEADLAKYRSTYGLPACTSDNGCFKKIDQRGGTDYPPTDAGWATEISLDLDMVSATCPGCHILLVEADSASFADLGDAVNQAADANPYAISNSYGGSDAADSDYGKYYDHEGIAVTASTGDGGYAGGSYPADSSYVTAVGGTSLTKDSSSRGFSESAWDGAGSGCAESNDALPAAADANTGCDTRAMADVSAVADPATGVAVYDSTPYQGASGWQVYGGTSASAPIIASVYTLAGDLPAGGYANAVPYGHTDSLFDVTSGDNGSCSPAQVCKAGTGWDGPTGLGTPNGTGAF